MSMLLLLLSLAILYLLLLSLSLSLSLLLLLMLWLLLVAFDSSKLFWSHFVRLPSPLKLRTENHEFLYSIYTKKAESAHLIYTEVTRNVITLKVFYHFYSNYSTTVTYARFTVES